MCVSNQGDFSHACTRARVLRSSGPASRSTFTSWCLPYALPLPAGRTASCTHVNRRLSFAQHASALVTWESCFASPSFYFRCYNNIMSFVCSFFPACASLFGSANAIGPYIACCPTGGGVALLSAFKPSIWTPSSNSCPTFAGAVC